MYISFIFHTKFEFTLFFIKTIGYLRKKKNFFCLIKRGPTFTKLNFRGGKMIFLVGRHGFGSQAGAKSSKNHAIFGRKIGEGQVPKLFKHA